MRKSSVTKEGEHKNAEASSDWLMIKALVNINKCKQVWLQSVVTIIPVSIIKLIILVATLDPVEASAGSENIPFGLKELKASIAEAKASGTFQVHLPEGTFYFPTGIILGDEASGTLDKPLIIKAAARGATTFSGGILIKHWSSVDTATKLNSLLPKKSLANIVAAPLPFEQWARPPGIKRSGFGRVPDDPAAELYYKDKPMTLARWPNLGYTRIKVEKAGQNHPEKLLLDGPNNALLKDNDLYATGFWGKDWADQRLPIEILDPVTGEFVIRAGAFSYTPHNGARIYIENARTQLDSPGEWYYDAAARIIYAWPELPPSPTDLTLSSSQTLLHITGASHIRIIGVNFLASRGTTINVDKSMDIQFEDCGVFGSGGNSVILSGEGNGLSKCLVRDSAGIGVALRGGDRENLSPGGNFVRDSDIMNFGRVVKSYAPGVDVSGVGQVVQRNSIHDGPHIAIQFAGNDHQISDNIIYAVLNDTGDAGAIYTGRDVTARGTTISGNAICDLTTDVKGGARGIYLDDIASGIRVVSNSLFNVQFPIYLGGGSDNIVEDNLIVGGDHPITLDARGYSWTKSPLFADKGRISQLLKIIPFRNEIYSKRYPTLKNVVDEIPHLPRRNVFRNNKFVDNAGIEMPAFVRNLQLFEDNTSLLDSVTAQRRRILLLTCFKGSSVGSVPWFAR